MSVALDPLDNRTNSERVSKGWTVAEMRRYETNLTWIGYGALALAAGFAGASFIEMSRIADSQSFPGTLLTLSKYVIPALIMGALFLLAKFYQHAMRDALEDNKEAETAFASIERDLSILEKALAETPSENLAEALDSTGPRKSGSEGGGQQGAAG